MSVDNRRDDQSRVSAEADAAWRQFEATRRGNSSSGGSETAGKYTRNEEKYIVDAVTGNTPVNP